jgi:hypothetical protein
MPGFERARVMNDGCASKLLALLMPTREKIEPDINAGTVVFVEGIEKMLF